MEIPAMRPPRHVALIMDGNGRWAQQQQKDRLEGHLQGVHTLKRIIEVATEIGVQYLTFYTFSTENWHRPEEEVNGLMELLATTIDKEGSIFHKQGARLTTIGDIDSLPENTRNRIRQLEHTTQHNTTIQVIIALNYSARWELITAVNALIRQGVNTPITTADFERHLSTYGIPDPELLIRTGGECRLSNFLLYQLAYSELYFTDTYWPAFTKEEFKVAVADYQRRERRFGKTSEQIVGSRDDQ